MSARRRLTPLPHRPLLLFAQVTPRFATLPAPTFCCCPRAAAWLVARLPPPLQHAAAAAAPPPAWPLQPGPPQEGDEAYPMAPPPPPLLQLALPSPHRWHARCPGGQGCRPQLASLLAGCPGGCGNMGGDSQRGPLKAAGGRRQGPARSCQASSSGCRPRICALCACAHQTHLSASPSSALSC